MFTRGQWQPLLPPRWRTVTTAVIPATPIIVGIDYILGGPVPQTLSTIENAAPIWVWGALLIASGLTTLAGYAGRWRHIAIVGLHISGALMLTLGAGVATETVSESGGFRMPWLYLAVGVTSWAAAIGYAAQVEVVEKLCVREIPCGPR